MSVEVVEDGLLRWREEFPILEKTVYLISNSLGAMPRGVRSALDAYATAWQTRGVRSWAEGWWELPVSSGDLLGPILGTAPGEVTFHQNVSIVEQVILSCFDFRGDRRKIVLSDLEFPSVVYVHRAQQALGAEICMVDTRDGIRADTGRLLEAIDERTLLVPLSHVFFRSAAIVDAAAVIRRAHDVGAMVILDVYQSAGVIPIDVKLLGADFVVGGCLKWLCGGPGAAFLYVRPDLLRRLQPRFTGWMAHERSFAFEIGDIRYRDDAFRFLNGTPHIPCLFAVRPGLELIGKIGVDKIRAKSTRQTALLIDKAREAGFEVTAPENPAERGGTVAIRCPHAGEVAAELLRRDVLVDFRPGAGIRVAPHFYTRDDEVEHVVREIRSIVDDDSWIRHAGQARYVT